jgi:predicted DNA-binding WGR domain protein
MREFRFKAGTSDKFWCVTVEGSAVTVRFGRTGTKGQTKTKRHPTASAAQGTADRLVREKLREGYVEASAPGKTSTGSAAKKPAPATVQRGAVTPPAAVVFVDAFGLTRIGPDDRVKTANVGAPPGSVSSDAAGRTLFVHRPNKVNVLVDPTSLAERRRLDSGSVLHPDGSAAVDMGSTYGAFVTPIGASKSKARSCNLPGRSIRKLKPLAFGPDTPSRDACAGPCIAFGVDGAFVAFGAREDSEKAYGSVLIGSWPSAGKPPQIAFEMQLRLAPGSRFAISLDGKRAVVAVHEVASKQAHLAIIDEQGKPSVRSFASVDVPVAADGAVAWQPDEGTVVREPLAGGARAELSLPAITRAARQRGKATPLPNEGRGQIAISRQRTLYLPWHGETVLDLDRRLELSRQLPKGAARERDAVRATRKNLEPILDDAGIHLEVFEVQGGDNPDVSVGLSGARDVVIGAFVQEAMAKLLAQTFTGSYRINGELTRIQGTMTRDELLGLLRFTDAHALPFALTADFWCDTYDRELAGHAFGAARSSGAALEKDAEPVLLAALLDALAPSKQPLAAKLQSWQKGTPTADGVLAALNRLRASRLSEEQATALGAVLWVVSHQFRSDSAPIWDLALGRILDSSRISYAALPMNAALKWLVANDSGARARLASALAHLADDHEEAYAYGGLSNLLDVVGVTKKADGEEGEQGEDTEEEKPRAPARSKRSSGKLSWDAFGETLDESVHRRGKTKTTDAQLGKAAKALGLPRLPASYCEYQRRFGGLGEWKLGGKAKGVPPTLTVRKWSGLKNDRDHFNRVLDAMADSDEHGKALADRLRHLLPIGSDGSRSYLCWDPKKPGKAGELGLCFVVDDDWSAPLAQMRHDFRGDLLDLIQLFHYG